MPAQTLQFDIIVIGGGPAGYVGAIRAAQLGLKTACVERDRLGGICLNWGCIPTKALLANAEFYHRLTHEAADMGILADNIRFDWSKIISRSRGVADNLSKGIGFLFKKNKITHIEGVAKVTQATSPATSSRVAQSGKVEVRNAAGELTHILEAKSIVIATGASPRALPFAPFDRDKIITSKEAMSLPTQPKKLLIVGAGAIGMEFAYFYNAFGTQVTVIEMLERVLPNEDIDVSKAVERSFKKQGIEVMTATKTLAIKKTDAGVELTVSPVAEGSATQTLTADKVLVAVGVKGNVEGLLSPTLGVEIFKDSIKVNRSNYESSVKGIFAVGDVNGPPWLAHVAMEEAINCVEAIAGHKPYPIDYDAIPGCTYCNPQVASLGLTEQAAKAKGLVLGTDYVIGKFPFSALGKAQATGHTEGFAKLLSNPKTGEILGAHLVGDNVTELLAELGLAKRVEATIEEVIVTMHAHPTLTEAIHEAALASEGRMIHM